MNHRLRRVLAGAAAVSAAVCFTVAVPGTAQAAQGTVTLRSLTPHATPDLVLKDPRGCVEIPPTSEGTGYNLITNNTSQIISVYGSDGCKVSDELLEHGVWYDATALTGLPIQSIYAP